METRSRVASLEHKLYVCTYTYTCLGNKQQIEKRCKIDIESSDHRIRGPVESCVGFERQTLPNAKTNKVVEEEILPGATQAEWQLGSAGYRR